LKSCGQQLSRIVDAVYTKSCFGKQVRVSALAARSIEDA
jgi:hypothetical protein